MNKDLQLCSIICHTAILQTQQTFHRRQWGKSTLSAIFMGGLWRVAFLHKQPGFLKWPTHGSGTLSPSGNQLSARPLPPLQPDLPVRMESASLQPASHSLGTRCPCPCSGRELWQNEWKLFTEWFNVLKTGLKPVLYLSNLSNMKMNTVSCYRLHLISV